MTDPDLTIDDEHQDVASDSHLKADNGSERKKQKQDTFSSYPTWPLEEFEFPKLVEMGQDLTFAAGKGKIRPVYGREKEIRQITEILRRRVKRNPVLVGEAGVGKTAIVEALALRIVEGQVPEWLQNKKIIAITLFDVIAQSDNYSFGEYAQRLKDIIKEFKQQDWEPDDWGRIAFFDELHTLKEYLHGANFLKQHLARGEIQLIGATTLDEYRQYIERDPALERRFAPVFIEEPSAEATIEILMNLGPSLEQEYKVKISDSAVKLAVELSHRYIYDRHQPDKSIELLDRACVRVLTTVSNKSLGRRATESPMSPIVQEEHIRAIVSEWTGIPDSSLSSERQKYLELENELKKRVIGQNNAISQVVRTIIANKAGTVAKPQKPNGVFLFVGPTGVGKTELAKALAVALTGKEEHLVMLDMTGYRDAYAVTSLVGVPSGNYSTPELPTLTKLVRNHPFGILLLDEIDKAHPEVLSLFMPVFEDGTLVDKQGSTLHFSDMIIVMTAHLDAVEETNKLYKREKSPSIQVWRKIYEDEVVRLVKDQLKLPQEFFNRIDEIVVYYPLAKSHIELILNIQLDEMQRRLNLKLELTKAAFDFLVKTAYDPNLGGKPELGARELLRKIDYYLGSQLALMKLQVELDAWAAVSKINVELDAEGTGLLLESVMASDKILSQPIND